MRLIDADALPVVTECCMDEAGYLAKFNVVHEEDIKKAPTVNALVLPCKVGDTVWTIAWKQVHEAKVDLIRPFVHENFVEFRGNVVVEIEDPFFQDGRLLKQDLFVVFGKDSFLTREEAKAALAKMDGGMRDVDLHLPDFGRLPRFRL